MASLQTTTEQTREETDSLNWGDDFIKTIQSKNNEILVLNRGFGLLKILLRAICLVNKWLNCWQNQSELISVYFFFCVKVLRPTGLHIHGRVCDKIFRKIKIKPVLAWRVSFRSKEFAGAHQLSKVDSQTNHILCVVAVYFVDWIL